MYVSDLMEELKKGRLDVVEGTLYPLLTRLKNGEFLSYRWEESTGGPPRKYYQITDKGNLFLAELVNTWKELNESVNQITKNNNQTNGPETSFQPNS
jgi:PadR family transcriptional regulator PadR